MAVLGVNRVDLSAKVLGALVALEFLVVIVYDVVSFGIAAFMGFESAAIYGEEA